MGKNESRPDRPTLLEKWKRRARQLELETYALSLAYKDPQTPWYAKVWAGLVLAYAFSPIDLIPDFIPVLGLMDDLVLVPLGVALALRMIPAKVMADAREQARRTLATDRPGRWAAAAVVVLIWLALLALVVSLVASLGKR